MLFRAVGCGQCTQHQQQYPRIYGLAMAMLYAVLNAVWCVRHGHVVCHVVQLAYSAMLYAVLYAVWCVRHVVCCFVPLDPGRA